MPKVTFSPMTAPRQRCRRQRPALSLMRAAVDHDVPGIDADCGGPCACATCHVFVEPRLGRAAAADLARRRGRACSTSRPSARTHSRLACQIALTDALDGLTVSLPLGQH